MSTTEEFPQLTMEILPRVSMSREEFTGKYESDAIALDGVVLGGPFFDEAKRLINFDHHDNVIREITMSTAMQVYFAIKGGLFEFFKKIEHIKIVINDTDQDTALAVWLLKNHHLFEGAKSIPSISRFLSLNDRWDITGGSFPMLLDDKLILQHAWVFEPYTNLRKSGALATADAAILSDNLESCLDRINFYMTGNAGEAVLDTRYEIFFQNDQYVIYNEIGGSAARHQLWANGMKGFVALIAFRPDGRRIWSLGRKSRYIPFPIPQLYKNLSQAEKTLGGVEAEWNGSDIVGGSNRSIGSGLSPVQIKKIVDETLGHA